MAMNNKGHYQFSEGHDQQLRHFLRIMLAGLLLLVLCGGAFIWYADRILILVPLRMERDFVRPYEKLLLKYWTTEDQHVVKKRYLQRLTDALTRAMQMTELDVVKVHYVDSDAVNAFATLGGNIIVCRGLYEMLPDENSLAMVLAHEIAHVKNRDPIVGMGRGAVLQIAYGFLTGNSGHIFGTGSEMGMMFFSREQEIEADIQAVVALNRHYGHVAGATTFFEMMLERHESDEEKLPKWFSTHPKLDARADAIREYVAQQGWKEAEVTPKAKSAFVP
jgi:predicted Zn-dependent protease